MDECSDELLAELRAQEDLPDAAVSVLASLDGVMVHMKAETADGKNHRGRLARGFMRRRSLG